MLKFSVNKVSNLTTIYLCVWGGLIDVSPPLLSQYHTEDTFEHPPCGRWNVSPKQVLEAFYCETVRSHPLPCDKAARRHPATACAHRSSVVARFLRFTACDAFLIYQVKQGRRFDTPVQSDGYLSSICTIACWLD